MHNEHYKVQNTSTACMNHLTSGDQLKSSTKAKMDIPNYYEKVQYKQLAFMNVIGISLLFIV